MPITSAARAVAGAVGSDHPGLSLAAILGGDYKLDDTGTFTDTANYTDLVGECTNISVGYYDQHTSLEVQDIQFAEALLDVLISSDFSTLVVERKAGDLDLDYQRSSWFRRYRTYMGGTSRHADVWSGQDDLPFNPGLVGESSTDSPTYHLRSLVLEHPEIVAAILEEYGVAPDEILSRAYAHY